MSDQKYAEFDSFLLGFAIAKLYNIQNYLIQGDDRSALSDVNDCLRYIESKIDKHYPKENG